MTENHFQRSAVIEDGFRALSNDSNDSDNIINTNQSKKSFIVFKIIIATVLVLFVSLAALSGTDYNSRISTYYSALQKIRGDVSTTTTTTSTTTDNLGVSVSGTVTSFELIVAIANDDYDTPASLDYLPWDFLIEPYRTQKISVEKLTLGESTGDSLIIDLAMSTSYTVQWSINGVIYNGPMVEYTPTTTGVYDMDVTITDISSRNVYSTEYTVAVKYIRREIRTLSDTDREKYFTALETLYNVDQTTGEALYGDKYKSAEFLLWRHLNGAGTVDCDHWHDGAGIITHHAAFTLEAEQSLQSVDPSVAMTYWEYPVDASYYDNYNWVNSPIFAEDWYGEASPSNDDHKISKGRWSETQLPDGTPYKDWSIAETGTLNPLVNGYGYLRSPWNNNPSPYIGRCNTSYGTESSGTALGRASCDAISSCYASTSLAAMNDCMNGYTHGPVHILIGGAWEKTSQEGEFDEDTEDSTTTTTTTDIADTTTTSTTTTSTTTTDLTIGTTTDIVGILPLQVSRGKTNPAANVGGMRKLSKSSKSNKESSKSMKRGGTRGFDINPTDTGDAPVDTGDIPSPIAEDDDDSVISFLQGNMKLLMFKMLWRYGWTRCPTDCAAGEECLCKVPDEYIDTYGAYYILDSSGVMLAGERFIDDDYTDDEYELIVRTIEDPGVAGEMFSSSAPYDPTFWPLHGTIERLLGLKRIKLSQGEITSDDFDETWGYDTDNYLYLVGICDWSAVQSNDDLTLPTCNMSSSAICPGHNENDVLEFTNFQGQGETYTNAELYKFIHPWNDDLPYTYDAFDYDYCYDYFEELEF